MGLEGFQQIIILGKLIHGLLFHLENKVQIFWKGHKKIDFVVFSQYLNIKEWIAVSV